MNGVPALVAIVAGVKNIPTPMIKLITIIVRSHLPSLDCIVIMSKVKRFSTRIVILNEVKNLGTTEMLRASA